MGKKKKRAGMVAAKWLMHYSSAHSILIVGDGDFSSSLALATAFGSGRNLVATSLDIYEALRVKYSNAESNVLELKRLGATVLHGVDATTMKSHGDLKEKWFDRIVFNFPHAGFLGREDEAHVINAHKELVRGFFSNASYLLRPHGEIHVSHKVGHPYDSWDLEQLASEYNQKRGDGPKSNRAFKLDPCCTFEFQHSEA